MSLAESLPGYRRRIRIESRGDAGGGVAIAMLEDDIHGAAVTLRHDGRTVTAVEPYVDRLPWTTCPGAQAKLIETFAGARLTDVTARRDKTANCTHLHDLAVLAAAHAGVRDGEGLTYDVFVSDPVGGERLIALRRDGRALFEWTERDGKLVAPAEIAGQTLSGLRDWINALPDEGEREAARVLQWASLVAYGRTIPLDQQSHAASLPPSCYTFQPERAVLAIRNGELRDFSDGVRTPLAGFADKLVADLG